MKKILLLCGLTALIAASSAAAKQHKNPLKRHLADKKHTATARHSISGTAERTQAIVFKPTKEKISQWNANAWAYAYDKAYAYDSNGNITEETVIVDGDSAYRNKYSYNVNNKATLILEQQYDGTDWVDQYRTTLSYNAKGQETQVLTEYYNSISWDPISRSTTAYDDKENFKEFILEAYENNNWIKNYGERVNSTYDGQSRATMMVYSDYDSSSTQWKEYERLTLGYSAANTSPTSMIVEEFDSTEWVNLEKYIDFEWYTWNGLEAEETDFKKFTYQAWTGTTFQTVARVAKTYTDAYGSYAELSEITEDNGASFQSEYRAGEDFDSYKNRTRYYEESYYNGSWDTEYEEKNIHTYNGQGARTQTIDQVWTGTELANYLKHEFSDFQELNVGITAKGPSLQLSAYPNPSTGSFTLHYSLLRTERVDIAAYNALGARIAVLAEKATQASGAHSLIVELPAKGLYYLVVQTESSTSTLPVVVE